MEKAPQKIDFEQEIDGLIDRYFETKRVAVDAVEMEEKRLIIKELSLSNKKSEIVPKLNKLREDKGLPALTREFDVYYYQREYAELIDNISLQYAKHLAKRYRFANRITRVGKLNDIAENVLERIRSREERIGELDEKSEKVFNDTIKLFVQLLGAIDEQMGKLRVTQIDVGVRTSEQPVIENAGDVKNLIAESLKKYISGGQLPQSVDANFTEVTDFRKCDFGEEWTNGHTHCQFFGEQCKVQTDEMSMCPHFINKIALGNKEHMGRLFKNNDLSARQIAEIAGCKEIDDRIIERVRKRLKEHGLWRQPSEPDTRPAD